MSRPGTLKLALKRGALVTAANWQAVLVQFVADTLFKTLLAVPIVGGVVLAVLLAGGDPADLLRLEPTQVVQTMVSVLIAQPLALVAFGGALGLVLVGGSMLMCTVQAGTLTVLVAGERAAGTIEHPPLRLAALRRANAASIERFMEGAQGLFSRYLRLAISLWVVYSIVAAAYLTVVFATPASLAVDWPLLVALSSIAVVIAVTLINFVYLLIQVVIAAEDCPVHAALPQVATLLRRRPADCAQVLAITLSLMVLSTAASILATAALGLIAFVPFVGLAALPLQLIAWLVRGVVFQFVGLTGTVAYLRLHRTVTAPAVAMETAGERTAPVRTS